MNLKTWKNFDEKEKWFEYKRIDSINELLKFIFKSRTPMFYRGMNNASYKQYSSIQRYCSQRNYDGEFHNFEKKLIKDSESYFKKNTQKSDYNELSVLSFLQHYGCWTPILDFSTDLTAALFFALDGASPYERNNNISDYISIYAVKQKFQEDLSNMQTIIDNSFAPPGFDKRTLATYDMAVSWNTPIELCDQFICNSYNYLKLANKNIQAQKGLFVLNPSKDNTLEDYFNGETFERCDYSTDDLFYGKMHCWDINKKFIKILKVYLFLKGRTKKSIYPDKNRDKIQNHLRELANTIPF